MTSRKYFTKAVQPEPEPEPLPRLVVGTQTSVTTGKVMHRLMSGVQAKRLLDAARAGQIAHAKGKARQWTSAQASRAAKKLWKRRRIMASGHRNGVKSKRRPQVKRAPLRALYSMKPSRGVWYNPLIGWQRRVYDGKKWLTYGISDRTALEHLGYIPSRNRTKGFVPEGIIPVPTPAHMLQSQATED